MVSIRYTNTFRKNVRDLRHGSLRVRLKKLVGKVLDRPEIGKPMRHERKGTREVRMGPLRVAYTYADDTITFIAVYHKDEQ